MENIKRAGLWILHHVISISLTGSFGALLYSVWNIALWFLYPEAMAEKNVFFMFFFYLTFQIAALYQSKAILLFVANESLFRKFRLPFVVFVIISGVIGFFLAYLTVADNWSMVNGQGLRLPRQIQHYCCLTIAAISYSFFSRKVYRWLFREPKTPPVVSGKLIQ
ncbi:MAG TPA: hypothetical protein VIK74_03480 [Parasegetibacter sp.]